MKDRLRRALRQSAPPGDLIMAALARLAPGVAERLFPGPLIPAAVLVGLLDGPGGLEVLLTRRTDSLRDHPGQISFPGGRLEAGERDPATAALREAREEVGLESAQVELIGYLPPQAVITGFAVSPVVGLLACDFQPQPDPAEVAEVFTVPLNFLLDPDSLRLEDRLVRGIPIATYACQFGPHRIWGATAQILVSLCEMAHDN